MQREEVKKLIRIIVDSYPNYKPGNLAETVDVWTYMLSDFSYQEIAVALKAFILTDTSGFAPSIGQLVQMLRKSNETEQMSELEAWDMVSKAVRRANYYAEEEFEKLPELVKKCVGSPSQLRNWAQSDLGSIETVIQSNFLKTYRAMAKREQDLAAIPENVRELLGKISCAPKVHETKTLEAKNENT